MKKLVSILTIILLLILMIVVVFHLLTAIPVVLDTNVVLMLITGLLLVFSLIGLKISDKRNIYFLYLFISVCILLYSAYDGFFGFEKNDIIIDSNGTQLVASLYQPTSGCPCPGVVFVHGSGPETRDEYKYYAKKFAKKGIVSIIYDKRGTGTSKGNLYSGGYRVYSEDASNVFKHLNTIRTVGAKGFIGFSEGEWVVPMAYTNLSKKPDFIIIVGASGLSPAQQVNEEIEIRLEGKGFSDDDIAEAIKINEAVYNFQRHGTQKDSLINVLSKLNKQPHLIAANDIPLNDYELGEYKDYEWWRSVMDTDPKELWGFVNINQTRLLFIKGGLDTHSYSNKAKERLSKFINDGESGQVEFIEYKNADHMILEWPFGKQTPPPVFAKNYLATLTDWIKNEEVIFSELETLFIYENGRINQLSTVLSENLVQAKERIKTKKL